MLVQKQRAATGHLLDPNNEAQRQATTENLETGGNSAVSQTAVETNTHDVMLKASNINMIQNDEALRTLTSFQLICNHGLEA